MAAVVAIEVGLWPTLVHIRNGLIQGAVVVILRVATIALGLKRDRSRILKVCRPTPRAAWLPVPTPNPPQMQMI